MMDDATEDTARARPTYGAGRLALRAALPALVLCVALAFVATNLFVLPDGAAPFVWLGAGLAVAIGTIALRLQAAAVLVPAGRPLAGQRLVVALAAGFLLQVAGAAGGILVMHGTGMKFPWIVALGVTFAGAALVFQVAGGLAIGRTLRRGSAGRTAGAGAVTT